MKSVQCQKQKKSKSPAFFNLFVKKYLKARCKISSQSGFTLMELIVVLAILGVTAGAIIANYAGQRPQRNLLIAQNELVSNLRKVQSYTLSSRNVLGSTAVQYYVLKFDLASSSSYSIQALYNVKTPPVGGSANLANLQTINLPQGIKIKSINVGSPNPNATPGCVLIAFKLPFAKIIINSSCTINPAQTPPLVQTGDDYDKLIKFVSNNNTSVSSDTKTTITLGDDNGAITRWVIVNGITGLFDFQ